ncbi:unnamed protein product, partial [Rotaria magnacalcarata]
NTYQTVYIIRRWIWIFEQSSLKNVCDVEFSTDGHTKYMRTIRLATGFLVALSNIKLNSYTDAFHVKIPK